MKTGKIKGKRINFRGNWGGGRTDEKQQQKKDLMRNGNRSKQQRNGYTSVSVKRDIRKERGRKKHKTNFYCTLIHCIVNSLHRKHTQEEKKEKPNPTPAKTKQKIFVFKKITKKKYSRDQKILVEIS